MSPECARVQRFAIFASNCSAMVSEAAKVVLEKSRTGLCLEEIELLQSIRNDSNSAMRNALKLEELVGQ